MDIQRHLILVKGEDKTEKIDFCKYESGKYSIKFLNNHKVFKYNANNIEWYRNPKYIEPSTNIVYENNQPISGIVKILDFGSYIRLVFKTGYKKVYRSFQLYIEETCLNNQNANNCFVYLKTLADHVSVKVDGRMSLLSKQYSELTTVSPRSVLSSYLEAKPLSSEDEIPQLIFPFGFNLSQKAATENAITEQASIIEGPPGTGKTQTILNIIANAVVNGKTVAVVSNNNSATANVVEKLEKYGLDFIAAYLGSKENKEKFFGNQKNTYPNMSNWQLSKEDFRSIKKSLKVEQKKLNEMLAYKNKQAVLKQELASLNTEYEYFNKYYTESNFKALHIKSFSRFRSNKLLKLLVEYKQMADEGTFTVKNKLYNMVAYRIYNFKFYKIPKEVVISYLQKTYYEAKINEIQNQINQLETKLADYDFENAMKQYSSDSMKLFKAQLAGTYGKKRSRNVFTSDVLWRNFNGFINEYPVILSTTHSLRNCAAKNYLFDYVLIDEASQVDIVTGALALSCAKNAVIVGDQKQLPNVVPPDTRKVTTGIFESYDLNEAYNYANNSLLSSFQNLYKDIPKTLLKEHYRCHPQIIGYCNQKFYNNELIVLTDDNESDKPLVLYKTVKGNHARGKFNQRQIDIVFEEIIPKQKFDLEKQSLGAITPYRLQANELQKVIGTRNIEADTVHKYQGRERDIIILTTVANEVNANYFVDDPNLINVAVSRAVDQLIVVVADGSENWKGTNIGDLVRYIKYNNFEVIESQIYSVFDLLYSSYSDKLMEVRKRSKKVSKFDSENLMNNVIEKVLSLPKFQSLDHVLHQPLRMLIKDPVKLTDEERKYAMNILTHTDFVIYNKIDKMPVLVVEVDGHAYHANNPVQRKRDEMKDTILKKYDIPIIRMKTTGSGEEKKLREKLSELLAVDSNIN
ncbi:AAA domain-containing protein [Bacillus shivajii]|uniref:AAA domain-containing protein n=1 Tax=Bacillus shivajii TaxID=1983719 RepID=UPI001CF9FA93|nr:AAA domain-containing protein [Bacillus shivajii]UCZ54996.1 AAA domain-containing protein [Bacillus shivajii]